MKLPLGPMKKKINEFIFAFLLENSVRYAKHVYQLGDAILNEAHNNLM